MSLTSRTDLFGSLILPVYNGGAGLGGVLEQVHAWLAERPEKWELIVVDDGSPDGTGGALETFSGSHRDEAITLIRLSVNHGKGFAVRVGMARARGRYVLFTDCDLAYPLANVDRILRRLENGADAAIACRVLPESTYLISPSFFSYLYTRHVLGRLFNWVCRLLTVPGILDTQAGLKGFRRSAVAGFLERLVLDGFSFDVELLRALEDRGARIEEVPVTFRYDSEPTTVRFLHDAACMVRDLVRVRLRSWRGRYLRPEPATAHARLVVTADDYGLAPGVNRAIEEALERGAVTGASILAGCPYDEEALRWAAAHREHDFGAHLNLTLGRPVLSASRVPSLVSRDGRFHSLPGFLGRYLIGRIRFEEIHAEWEAQITRILEAGVQLRRLDSHRHVHLLPGLYRKVVLPLATRNGLAVRTMDGPVLRCRGLPSTRGMVLSLLSRLNTRRDRSHGDRTRGFGSGLDRRPTIPALRSVIERLEPRRRYELVVHPGRVDAALRASGDGYLDGREAERRLLLSNEAAMLLDPFTGGGRREDGTPRGAGAAHSVPGGMEVLP